MAQGFGNWNKRDFNNFINACTNWGRCGPSHGLSRCVCAGGGCFVEWRVKLWAGWPDCGLDGRIADWMAGLRIGWSDCGMNGRIAE